MLNKNKKLNKCLRCFLCLSKFPEEELDEILDCPEDSEMGNLRTAVIQNMTITRRARANSTKMEANKSDKPCGIKLRHLCKSRGGEMAVKSLTCDFFTDDVSVLLG